jgi:hypothetical protein
MTTDYNNTIRTVFNSINWKPLSLAQTKQTAIAIMSTWNYQLPHSITQRNKIVEQATTKRYIITKMREWIIAPYQSEHNNQIDMFADVPFTLFNAINWKSLDLPQTKQAAITIMATWDWQTKVPEYTKIVNKMRSQYNIKVFIYNCISNGVQCKARIHKYKTDNLVVNETKLIQEPTKTRQFIVSNHDDWDVTPIKATSPKEAVLTFVRQYITPTHTQNKQHIHVRDHGTFTVSYDMNIHIKPNDSSNTNL